MTDITQDYWRKEVAAEIKHDIDAWALREWGADYRRKHLGASLIGAECTRQTWYSFRWYAKPPTNGRMQRLFNRGHREEERFVQYLRGIGATVWELDPNTGKQWLVSRLGGHFGGSLDGIVQLPPKYNIPFPVLGEFKTKGTGRGFESLKDKGIMMSNSQHFDQMSTYGANYTLPYALYNSVNKNDDDLHIEIVPLNFKRAAEVEQKATYIIAQNAPPPKVSQNPTFWLCKGCDFRGVCHENHVPVKNCRTCEYARPVDGAAWYCLGWQRSIPEDVQHAGCEQWTGIRSQA